MELAKSEHEGCLEDSVSSSSPLLCSERSEEETDWNITAFSSYPFRLIVRARKTFISRIRGLLRPGMERRHKSPSFEIDVIRSPFPENI